jgi:TolB-like protein/Tfp pilus assembly protein PilF
MGAVYRAADTKLGREVALKVLPPEVASDPERLARFRREARAVAALNHPHIVTIFSVEEAESVHFLTMELVEGKALDRLIPAGGMTCDQIVEIASALADALAAAHEKGIVHRDLKPANVMVSNEGRVKVLDFGLAKDVGASNPGDATLTSDHRTQVGVVMGTPAYMSPEQTSGRPLDHRTDIFSMGVVLHEMATGRRPFEGSSPAELASAILRDTPVSVTDLRPDLPSDLARIVRRCLEKDPRHRVQTARDVSNEFRDLAKQTSQNLATPKTSTTRTVAAADSGGARADEGFWVAVLPFKYTGSDANLMGLADGLTDDILTGLSKFSYLRVIARSSTAPYAKQAVDVRGVARDLGARYVMEGSLRQAGSKLRLGVQLVDATTGAHLWAENYERAFSPEAVFELQDDLVPRIVSTVADMNGALPRSMGEAVRGKAPEQLSPYEAVLRSFAYFDRYTPEELSAARSGLEAAVRKVPAYADAWAMLSVLCAQDYVHGYELQANALEAAASAARRAVEAGPANHLAYFSLAQVLSYQKDFDSFRDAAERAVALNPMDGNSVALLGELLTYAGHAERGRQLAERAKQLNPNHPGGYWYADFYDAFSQGNYRGALGFALKCKLRGNPLAPMFIAAAAGQLGETETGAKAVADLLKFRPELPALMRKQVAKIWNPEYGELFLEGLRKAGLEIPEAGSGAGKKIASPPGRTQERPDSSAIRAAVREDEGFWVAVLPFKYTGGDAALKALAEALSEEVITGLSRFSYLRVIARGSTSKHSGESGDTRAIGKELGARYLMEGSLRQAGTKLRLAVQLVDATTGTHLWAENYERNFSPDAVFELQDELVPRIVSTVADMNGMLPRSMSEGLRSRAPEQLSPYEAVLRSFSYWERVTPEDLAAALAGLESAVQKAPAYADAWAMLALLFVQEYGQGFNLHPDPLTSGLAAARRAVEAGPSNHLAYFGLAQALFFQKEYQSCRNAAERAVALNPMDGNSIAFLGELVTYAGDRGRGLELSGRAKQLNPNHPGWYWYADFYNAYRQGDYRGALGFARKFNMPNHWGGYALMVAVCGQLGESEAAGKALRDLLKLRPDFAASIRKESEKWWDPEYVERMMEGWRKAGLEIADDPAKPRSGTAPLTSGASRADDGFWVAVLPFKYSGGNSALTALAEGLTEDIVTGLSRFSYLRVIARSSTSRYANQSVDVRTAGKELGARFVMEGSLRQAGSKLRLAVQLVDAVSGAHLWAENFERTFDPDTVFALQDELVPRIVSTVADAHGILPHTMSEVIRGKSSEQLSPYEAVLRSFGYAERISPEEHAMARDALERAVQLAPNYAYAWAMLSFLNSAEYEMGFNPKPEPLERALRAARRAVELDSSGHRGYQALALVLFLRREIQAFRTAAEKAIALNPMDGCNVAQLGGYIAYAGEWERGCALVEQALRLNPNHPGWFWFPLFFNAYRQRDYSGALNFALKVNLPAFYATHMVLAAAYGQLGQRDEAAKAVQELLKLRPDIAMIARPALQMRYAPELVEDFIDGLRKAGLEIAGGPSAPGGPAAKTDA